MSNNIYPYRARVNSIPKEYAQNYPFKQGDIVCVLGELVGMQGHYVIALGNGKIVFGYHDDWFSKIDGLPDEEVIDFEEDTWERL
jgi:hypothetical protein